MELKYLKKTLVSLGIGIMLTFGIASSVSASEETLAAPVVSEAEDVQPASYSGASTKLIQTSATDTTVSLQWNPVKDAAKYYVGIKSYTSTSGYKTLASTTKTACTIRKLTPGKAYRVRIVAATETEMSNYQTSVVCTTLYNTVKVSSVSSTSSSYTFRMQAPTPADAITGYRVSYTSCSTNKTVTKYYKVNKNHTFTITGLKNDTFYKTTIRPYITLNGKKCISTKGVTRYIALHPGLKKSGITSNSMTVKWAKTAGATSYTIYIKYPGSSSYKKIRTTSGTTFKLTNMKIGQKYYIKVIANKKVGSKTWKSPSNQYYVMNLFIH